MAEAYPLHWPAGWPRSNHTERSRFDCSLVTARKGLFNEIALMNGRYPVLSTNIELRRDGLPYAWTKEPDDKGVAVYFEYQSKQMVFACDRWDRVRDNMQAIRRTISAIRGIERWGASDMMERAFLAFEALPDFSSQAPWRHVLEISSSARIEEAHAAYRRKVKEAHPDAGGSPEQFAEIQNAWSQAQEELSRG